MAVITLNAGAQTNTNASFTLDSVAVSQIVKLVYTEAIKTSYMLDPVVVADMRPISFRFDSTKGNIKVFMNEFLSSLGYSVTNKAGVDFVGVKQIQAEAEKVIETEYFVYKPKHRDSTYLADIIGPLFAGSFTAKRTVEKGNIEKPAANAPQNSAANQIDKKTDTIVYNGTAKEIAQMQKLLAQIDVPGGQIMVRGALYEVAKTSSEGSAFQLATSILSGKFGITLGAAGSVLGNAVSLKTGGSFAIDAVLSALSTDSRFKVVSAPSLRVKDGATAKLTVGQEVPILGALSYPTGAGQAVQSVQYKSSGMIFDLTPQIRESSIDLVVMQQVSNFVSTTTGVNNSPTLTKRELSTSISVTDGDVIVLGGLNDSKSGGNESGLPFLPEIMRSKSANNSESEILLVIAVTRI